MKSKTDMPNSKVLNSKWQMLARRYGSSITGILWALLLLTSAAASIALHGVNLFGGLITVLGLAGLIFSAAFFVVARDSDPQYDLSEWSKAVREQHGEHSVIVLNVGGSVTVEASGRSITFPTATDAIRVASWQRQTPTAD